MPETRIAVCHEGAEHILASAPDKSILQQNCLAGRPYFLAVGLGGANKNQQLLLDAFASARLGDVRLVLTGRQNTRLHGTAMLKASAGVTYVGHVTDAQLRALYEGALALVYPSSYEGFGLPPLEAMACGCPVIISSQAALREVAKDAAEIVITSEKGALSAALQRLARDHGLRAHLSQLGRERIPHLPGGQQQSACSTNVEWPQHEPSHLVLRRFTRAASPP